MREPTTLLTKIPLEPGQELRIEPGAMHACKNVQLTTGLNGSVWSVAKLYFLGGESVFTNTYKAIDQGAWVALEEGHQGQVVKHQLLAGETLYLQKEAYIASDSHIKINTYFAGFSYFFKGLGLWKVGVVAPQDAPGNVFFGTKNGIVRSIKVDEKAGPVFIENNSIVGYTSGLTLSLSQLGNSKTTLFSGQGFVNETKGNGTVFTSTSVTKAEKANYIEQLTASAIESLTNGKLTAGTIVLFAGLLIIMSSRAVNPKQDDSILGFISFFLNELLKAKH